ncbi:endothelin-converting enzyme homolog isoform X2 [Biomphalaria glabrata]|uniref:Endothelin-converting enzyme homolog isoform X2 n=1 Tax=Biomphalaria glabrata TaxID=6526 RepID=A0A9W2ZRR6_BIOGL|nr:endothelin-converting enzyme homolog isoform X2 [Biomphalaria glabrata]
MWILFALLPYCVTSRNGPHSADSDTERVCRTEDCRLGRTVAKMLNTSVDPCEDMYEFSCGGWLRDNPLPAYLNSYMSLEKLFHRIYYQTISLMKRNDTILKCLHSTAFEKVKKLFKVCKGDGAIYYQGVGTLLELIDGMGSWTVTSTLLDWNETSWSLQNALEKSHSLWGTSFWSTKIERDLKNGSRYILYIFVPETERDTYFKKYTKMTVREFQTLLGSWIDLEQYFSAVFREKFLSQDDDIIVETPKYFEQLQDVIQETDAEVLANYIAYNFIKKSVPYLPTTSKTSNETKRSDFGCLTEINEMMPYAVGALYVENHLSLEVISKISIMASDIVHEFLQDIRDQDWIDAQTKAQMIAKLKSMTIHIGPPDWIRDPVKLDKEYEDLKVVEEEYLENFVRVTRFNTNKKIKEYKNLPEPPNPYSMISPLAYYVTEYNRIVILPSILQEYFVSHLYPDAYMYGLMGTIIGHELFHGFDSDGKLFDADGHLRDFWSAKVTETFNDRSKCLIDLFESESYTYLGNKHNGTKSLVETIADNAGIKYSFRAYRNAIKSKHSLPYVDLTEDQLFFVAVSQFYCSHWRPEYVKIHLSMHNHPINKFRVYALMSNSEDFASAFQCSKNATLNPENKCNIW